MEDDEQTAFEAFAGLAAAGRALLEGRGKPALRPTATPGKRWTLALLQEEARHNPRVHVALRVGELLVPIAYEGPRPETRPKRVPRADAPAMPLASLQIARGVVEGFQALRESALVSEIARLKEAA